MGYLGRRIGLSQDKGNSEPGAAGGAVGGGILDLFAHGYFERQGDIYNDPGIAAPTTGLTATGGIISDYSTPPGAVYRAHIFTFSGSFVVSELGDLGDEIEYLVVAGGGAGGQGDGGGGGGAGGVRTSTSTATVTTFPVQVGGGGAPTGGQGNDSIFNSVTAKGGGGVSGYAGQPGGSGGGGGQRGGNVGGYGYNPTTPAPVLSPVPLSSPYPITQGYPGGDGIAASSPSDVDSGGGGGGASSQGGDASPSGGGTGGNGGNGVANTYAHGPTNPVTYAGGGGGGTEVGTIGSGGPGGGGAGGRWGPGGSALQATEGTQGTGGGGGGGNSPWSGASGGSGAVVVRYKIADVSTAKATGGAISFYGGKTIHTFTGSGTFATTANWSAGNVEYIVVGGGGSGAGGWGGGGGGGGAGAYRAGTTPIGAHPVSTTIQIGAGGNRNRDGSHPGNTGTPSYFGSPITAAGGGYGGAGTGGPGGSGGGAGNSSPSYSGGPASGDPFPGTVEDTPSSGWGHAGGPVVSPGNRGGGGGGGAGGAGGAGAPGGTNDGGAGMQLPSTFRNPASTGGVPGPTSALTNGDTSGKYWLAGGGGGGGGSWPGPGDGEAGPGGAGPNLSTPYAGGGRGGGDDDGAAHDALANTGSGGGGYQGPGSRPENKGAGGSGIVLIAYPT